jgi:ABC-type branched-subunit amino acid transport system substrate-binding protein
MRKRHPSTDSTPTVDRRTALATVGSAGLAALAGCGAVGAVGGSGRAPIRLGGALSLTGPIKGFGKPMRDSMVLATDEVAASDADLAIEPRVYDTASTVEGRNEVVNQLHDDGFPMVCGPATTVAPVATESAIPNEMVLCAPSSTTTKVTNLDDDGLVYRTVTADSFQGPVMARLVADRLGDRSAAVSFVGLAYGELLAAELREAFESDFGGTVTASAAHDPGATSYVDHLDGLLADDPDALVVVTYPGSAVRMLRDYFAEFDGDHDLVLSDGAASPAIAREVDGDLSQVIGTLPAVAGPGSDRLVENYRSAYGRTPGPYVANAYDAAAVLLLANAAAGVNDGPAIADEVRSVANSPGEAILPGQLGEGIELARSGSAVNYQGGATPVNFDENGDLKGGKYLIWRLDPSRDEPLTAVDTVGGFE